MRIRNSNFAEDGKTCICGILNVTPDSFSDGGKWNTLDAALFHAEEMVREGAGLIDVGGESTRPGCIPIEEGRETERVIPVIEAIRSRLDVPLSVDTFHAGTARAAIEAGADLVNDISGLKADPEMAGVIAAAKVPCCLMHSRREAVYASFAEDLLADLEESLETARRAGIPMESVILDPGIGFGKTREQNLWLLNHLDLLKGFGLPLLLGASRKSVIGLTLNLPVGEREEGTLVTTVMAVLAGYRFVRVHNVKANVRAVRMAEAIRDAG